MKFIISREDFLHGLNIASHAISTNNTLPILSNILLKTEGGKLYLESTNLEISIRYHINADISNEGEITIPARLFQNYVALLKDEEIQVHVTEGYTVNITSSNSKTQIKGLSSKDFPQIPNIERKYEFSIPGKKLQEDISQVVFAASLSSVRPILSGVYMKGEKKFVTIVATDSYRLAEKKVKLEKEIDGDFQIIIPARTMIELARLINEDSNEQVIFIVSDNQAMFKLGKIEIISRLIDGQFPNYLQVIPQTKKSSAIIDKSELAQNIKRVGLFAKENNNNIKIFLIPNENKIKITTDATQIGTEEAEIKAKIEGEENKIAINSEYILDLLNALPVGDVNIAIDNKLAPLVIKHTKLDDYLHIIMPLKL